MYLRPEVGLEEWRFSPWRTREAHKEVKHSRKRNREEEMIWSGLGYERLLNGARIGQRLAFLPVNSAKRRVAKMNDYEHCLNDCVRG